MNISYNWLQTYFKEKLPAPEKLVDLFTFHSFEVEGCEKKEMISETDFIIDAKILPDRAHYALCHRGIAAEVAALTALPYAEEKVKDRNARESQLENPAPGNTNNRVFSSASLAPLSITVTDSHFCQRYLARRIDNVTVAPSPIWLKNRLESIGARSINSIVDATNFVMFDIGQPLHAFDADKVTGNITVRVALPGEKIVTLDGKEITLTPSDSVIADEVGPLAIAGVKGGKRAEVTLSTTRIIIEAAHFDAVAIRKTSTRVGIRNDSSKRFENAITPELAYDGMVEVTELIKKLSPDVQVGVMCDQYPHKATPRMLSVTPAYIQESLGLHIPEKDIIELLERLAVTVVKTDSALELTIPCERLDLVIKEDIVEEVGRLYGYDKIPSHLPPQTGTEVSINKTFYYSEKIKTILRDLGISEVYLYALTAKGHHEVAYPLASDKSYLRTELSSGIEKALELNVQNAALLGLEKIKIFEIGKVFTKEGEHTALSIGVKHARKFKGLTVNDEIRTIREHLLEKLGSTITTVCTIDDTGGILIFAGKPIGNINSTDGILELNLDAMLSKLPDPQVWDMPYEALPGTVYKPFSVYPFAVRDVAVFVPANVKADEIESIIKKHAGKLLVRTDLFDVFTKKNESGEEKTSYAFHIVLQSFEQTLSDPMITEVVDGIYGELTQQGWQIR